MYQNIDSYIFWEAVISKTEEMGEEYRAQAVHLFIHPSIHPPNHPEFQLLTANPGQYEALNDGRWCPPFGAHVYRPWRVVALVLVTEPIADDGLDPLRCQDQQDCGTGHRSVCQLP